MVKEKHHTSQDSESVLSENRELILYNDDFNTFEFVIRSLIEVCEHNPVQAEQCALITHFNGKCAVKTGSFNELKPVHDEMSNRDLTVSID